VGSRPGAGTPTTAVCGVADSGEARVQERAKLVGESDTLRVDVIGALLETSIHALVFAKGSFHLFVRLEGRKQPRKLRLQGSRR